MLNPSAFKTNGPLANFSLRFGNDLNDYIAQKLFTPQVVGSLTGEFYQYGKDNLRLESLDAPSGSEAKSGEYTAFKNTFTAKEKAWKGLVLGRDARNFDAAVADLNQEQAAVNMDKLLIELEDAAHTKATTSTNYPAALVETLAGTDVWTDAASNPVQKVKNMRESVRLKCGKYPNKMFLSSTGMTYLENNTVIRDMVKYTHLGPIPRELIASLMGLDEICVSKAVKNTGLEGAADSLASVWDDDAVIAYVDPSPKLKSMTYGKMFVWNNFYTKTIDKPELGRNEGAWEIETGWAWGLEFGARVSSSDGDAVAAGLLINIF